MVASYEVQTQNHARTLNIEDGYKGMKFTNSPLDQGYMRKLLNFNIVNSGTGLRCRPGRRVQGTDPIATWLENQGCESFVYSTGRVRVQDYRDDMITTVCRYAITGQSYTADATDVAHDLPERTLDASTMKVIIQYEGNFLVGTYDGDNALTYTRMPLIPSPAIMHELTLACGSRDGVTAEYDGNIYMPTYWIEYDENDIGWYVTHLMYLKCVFNAQHTGFTWTLEEVEPREVTAVQAVNYGYNMLKDDPYTFEITSHSGTSLLLDGILPYNGNGGLITTARAGEQVTFKLAYRYPTAHAGYHYVTMWELTDNNSENADTVTLQPIRKATSTFYQDVTAGDEISISTCQTSYTSFTLTCYVYNRADVLNVTYESATLDAVNCSPIGTMTVSFTYLTDNSASTSLNLGATTYDITSCNGMCTWQNRLVVWGVNGAPETLFVSEVNDPSWFPYPNNVEVYDGTIIRAIPFKDYLLVFTEDKLYQVGFESDGLSYSSTVVQQGLRMEETDANSILAIQNMLFFKNGNYYYMLVPGKYASNQYGELQLAPITEPIQEIFDDFNTFLNELYSDYSEFTLYDWHCYLEQNSFRLVYKIRLVDEDDVVTYKDLTFQYDTKSRGWTMFEHNGGPNRMVQFVQSSTIGSTYLFPYGGDTHLELWLVEDVQDVLTDRLPDSEDNVAPRYILDTGYRNIDIMHYKKFRMCMFNTTTQGTPFTLTPTIYVDNMKVYNEDTSFLDDDGLYIECYENDEAQTHETMDTVNTGTRRYWVTDRVCIPFAGRGRMARMEFEMQCQGTGTYRPEINNFSWVYRTKSARGGRDGNSE